MTRASRRLADLGLRLPPVPVPVAAYVPAVRIGDLVYTSGQLPFVDGLLTAVGRVGVEVSPEDAAVYARTAALNALAAVAEQAGELDAVVRMVKVVVFVACQPDFSGHPAVANGASELFSAVLGDHGVHVRSAVGVASLPLNAPVEVEVIAEVGSRPTIVPL